MIDTENPRFDARLARILAHARRTFGSDEAVSAWLKAPNRALGGATPLDLLERLVHTSAEHIGDALVLTRIDIPDALHVTSVLEHTLPRKWRNTPAPEALQRIGLAWLLGAETALLSVPSAIVPHERNMLINPAHADFRQMKAGKPESFVFGLRLMSK